MAKVVFIQVESKEGAAFPAKLGRLVNELVDAGRSVVVVAGSSSQAARLDDQLWAFDEESFIPHSRVSADTCPLEPVVLVESCDEAGRADVWVNFAQEPIAAATGTAAAPSPLIYEFMSSAGQAKDAARRKWTRYKELGAEMSHEKWTR